MLHLYFKASTCSWYVSNTHHSPVNVHVIAKYCIRSTPLYWSGLGRNSYGTDTYLPGRYSRSEYLFRTRSVATDLVTSLEIQPILFPIIQCHFGQTRYGYVATYFNLLSGSPASSATRGYVVLPEQFGQNEEPARSDEEGTKKKPSFVPKGDLFDAIVFPSKQMSFLNEYFCVFQLNMVHFLILSSYG